MKPFSTCCALLAVAASAATDYKKSYTGGKLTNGDKSVTAAFYTDWSLEGTGENQKIKQEMVQTLTWGEEANKLEVGEELQVYSIQQDNTTKNEISADLW